jgi:6-phosphogluconolactonase
VLFMKVEVLADADAVAREAAGIIAEEGRAAVCARGRFVLAVSGGRTPVRMLQALAGEDLPWNDVHIFQVDERVAPEGGPDRNLTLLRESLEVAPLPKERLHAMPVEEEDLAAAAVVYTRQLADLAGSPPILDLVHLGLGADGHTASLVPGDPVLENVEADVALTEIYQGRRRMTLTYPILNRARRVLWIVTGREKAEMLARLRRGDRSIPAGCVNRERAVILTDSADGVAQPGDGLR